MVRIERGKISGRVLAMFLGRTSQEYRSLYPSFGSEGFRPQDDLGILTDKEMITVMDLFKMPELKGMFPEKVDRFANTGSHIPRPGEVWADGIGREGSNAYIYVGKSGRDDVIVSLGGDRNSYGEVMVGRFYSTSTDRNLLNYRIFPN
ncbi:hypothetical protein GF386_03800 [Candidatus Pacearchaeota archaeon]|nr:hypothetical protein [Candidatus Pacearchaeota archaeon]MBD3283270.1 hypothetical protein [Candidatus Pacearchaeota archaeon]